MAQDKSDSNEMPERHHRAHETERRKPTAEDLAEFRRRVFVQLDRIHSSARGIEDGLGLARGSLSRIFSGRRRLRRHHLDLIAQALPVGPEELVVGTGLEWLLNEEPRPAPAESRRLQGELEQMRSILEAREIELERLRKEFDPERLHQLERAEARSMTRASEVESSIDQLRARLDERERDEAAVRATEAESALEQSRAFVGRLERQLAAAVARSDEAESTLGQSNGRIAGLERSLAEVQLALRKASERAALVGALEARLMRASELLRESRNYARHLEERVSRLQSSLVQTRRSGWAKGLIGFGLAVGALLFPGESPRRQTAARQDRRAAVPVLPPPPPGSRQPGIAAQQRTLH